MTVPSIVVGPNAGALQDFDSRAGLDRVGPMMQLRASLTLALALAVVGCGSSDQCVGGTGPIVSQTLDLSSVTGFDFQAAGQVTAVPGATQQVMVRAQQNVIDRLNRDVINGIWEIGFTQCVQNVSELRVELTLPALESVELSGAGTVNAQTESPTLDTFLSGAGTITLSGETTTQRVELSPMGSGVIEAFDLVTAETTVLLARDAAGTINVLANELLTVDLEGAGTVFYKGDPQLDVRISGQGTVENAN